ncbi:hypothetical protein [Guptibacillus hwajinpoensis]|uniref:Uncharacterized protein n=1 Tax=Guptibacillus hwajinpoensis TaxID=208199 RepID=A0A0J6D1R0_9BACL|nr:hypothetical protein AB986_02600 [Alkalihalobacillus macyae]
MVKSLSLFSLDRNRLQYLVKKTKKFGGTLENVRFCLIGLTNNKKGIEVQIEEKKEITEFFIFLHNKALTR